MKQRDKIDVLQAELVKERLLSKSLRTELDEADVIHYDEIAKADKYNNILTMLVVVMAIWLSTYISPDWIIYLITS